MKKEKFSRKGFTLIELLLVVVVIVILAGTIMVSGEESIISAEANNIINNMRIIKSAALEWIADYGDYIDRTGKFNYVVTYPFPIIKAADSVKIDDDTDKDKWHIQNVMRPDADSRSTMMKYINTAYPPQEVRIIPSVNEDIDSGSGPIEGGYAIVDASRNLGGGYNKWYVVYRFETEETENSRVKKLKQKIDERAQEFELYKNQTDFYKKDSEYVYMPIIDLAKQK